MNNFIWRWNSFKLLFVCFACSELNRPSSGHCWWHGWLRSPHIYSCDCGIFCVEEGTTA